MATGGLHLDGLADTADGLGSRRPADQALEIMRLPDAGGSAWPRWCWCCWSR